MAYTLRHQRALRRPSHEELVARLCLSGVVPFAPHVITQEVVESWSVHAADLDGGGDMDVLWASYADGKIAWYENTDGQGSFGPERVIGTVSTEADAGSAWSVHAAAFDGDGDMDVLLEGLDVRRDDENEMTHGKIAWYENTDGQGRFGPQQVISTDIAGSTHPADMDGDGDLDVLAVSPFALLGDEKVAWYWCEQLPALPVQPVAGDANRDFQFNQLDIVQVLQSAKYLTGESATWEEGDWGGDGVFDLFDIIGALQTGNYLQGPYVDAALR